MKKISFVITLVMLMATSSYAAVGAIVYESASSSVTISVITLSATTPVVISKGPTVSKQAIGELPISWYSTTLFNANASTAAYSFSSSSVTAPSPALTCLTGAPLGGGTGAQPWNQTEQFFGMFMWGISCNGVSDMNIKAVYRGR